MKILRTSRVEVDPAMAACFLAKTFDDNRKIKPWKVKEYAQSMRAGDWGESETNVTIGNLRGIEYLIGGQHRLMAQVEAGVTLWHQVQVREFDNYAEMVKSYINDTNGGALVTMVDKMRILGVDQTLSLPLMDAKLATSAVRAMLMGFDRIAARKESDLRVTAPNLAKFIVEWEKPIVATIRALDGANSQARRRFLRAPVLAVLITIMRYCPEKALPFIERCAGDDGLVKHTPEHTLTRFLVDNPPNNSMSMVDYSQKVARCWNAYYQGRTIQSVRGLWDTAGGIEISGTPFDDSAVDIKAVFELDRIFAK